MNHGLGWASESELESCLCSFVSELICPQELTEGGVVVVAVAVAVSVCVGGWGVGGGVLSQMGHRLSALQQKLNLTNCLDRIEPCRDGADLQIQRPVRRQYM